MSTFRNLLGDIRRLLLIDDKVSRMEARLDKLDSRSANQETRLVQLETVIFGPIPPDKLRLRSD